MGLFPLMLLAAGRPCIVVGDGPLADAKARLARQSGMEVQQFRSDTDGSRSVPKPARLGLAFVTLQDMDAAAKCSEVLRGLGYLVNVADQPGLCDFILPAIVDRAPVVIAISTGGASATMARQIRGRLEAELPDRLGDMVGFISTLRPAVASILTNADARRHFWEWATTDGGPCDPFTHHEPPGADDVLAAARSFGEQPTARHICMINLQTNDPADMTLRALRRMQQADVVLCIGLKEQLGPLANLSRRDAQVMYDEISAATIDVLANSPRSVILMPRGSVARPVRVKGAVFEFIYAGKAQL